MQMLFCLVAVLCSFLVIRPSLAKQPNIVLILNDDLDHFTSPLTLFPNITQHLLEKGTTYSRFFSPISICCPSRASLMRGQYAHNHNFTFVAAPWGGWQVFNEKGYNGEWLPSFLQEAGYDTYYVGKLMNGLNSELVQSHTPKGFNESEFLIEPNIYDYWNTSFSHNGGPPENYLGQYTTDVVAEKAYRLLETAAQNRNRPFFLVIAPIAPHTEILANNSIPGFLPPVPHPRHANFPLSPSYSLQSLVRSSNQDNFNPSSVSGASWVRELERLNGSQVEYFEDFWERRVRSFLSTDDLVGGVFERLEEDGLRNETVVIFTSDNGYQLGTHRRQPGKTLPYEEDIRIPFVVAGPGIPTNSSFPAAHLDASASLDHTSVCRISRRSPSWTMSDLSTSILALADGKWAYEEDGGLMPWVEQVRRTATTSVQTRQSIADGHENDSGEGQRHAEHAETGTTLHEFWVYGVEEGKYASAYRRNTTYRAVRAIGVGFDWMFSVWCTGERELYDMKNDSGQMNNLILSSNSTSTSSLATTYETVFSAPDASFSIERVASRLNAALLVLKSCKGKSCRQPWEVLSGGSGGFRGFEGSLRTEYDDYFRSLPLVRYSHCDLGYHAQLEAPFWDDSLSYLNWKAGRRR